MTRSARFPARSEADKLKAQAEAVRTLMRLRVVPLQTGGAALGLGPAATYEAAKRGEIAVLKSGNRMKVASATILRMLDLPVPPVDPEEDQGPSSP